MNRNSTLLFNTMGAYFSELLKLRLHIPNTSISRQVLALLQTVTGYEMPFYNLPACESADVQIERVQGLGVSLW